jgi:N-methylhydantoinase B
MTTGDPIQLEIIRNALVSAAEQMSVTVWRTSRSTVVREVLDYSTAIFDGSGRNIAQATRIPVHLNSMATCLETVLADEIPIADWHEGDVVVTNDPYSGGQHLPDILMFRPVFIDGAVIAIVGVLCHHLDVGGGAPGSYYPQATEIFQEGLRIPPLKIFEAGRRNDAVWQIILRNSRQPINVSGDLASQIAALEVGVQEVIRIAGRYGSQAMVDATTRIMDQSEDAMRAAITAMPDGTYSFEDFVDDDGITDDPLRIHVCLTIDGDRVIVDLSGSGAQARGPVNCTLNMSRSAVYFAVMSVADGDFVANSGCYRPIEIIAPEGLVVNCGDGAPVSNRMATGHRIVNAVMGAFAEVLPDRVPAAYYGVSYVCGVGIEDDDGSRDVYLDIEVGGWGAHPDEDGANAFSAGFHNLANSPLEIIEATYPVSFVAYGITPDSGGAGRTRGGLGLHREWRLEAARGVISANLERFRFPPYGLAGGEPGPLGRLILTRDDTITELSAKVAGHPLRRGDRIRLESSGGGGWGRPQDRARQAIADDLRDGYITPEEAQKKYAYVPDAAE